MFGIIGFGMLLGSDTTAYGVKYAGTFLAALGIYPTISNTISWFANNIEGPYKRGVCLGFIIGWGNLNGVVSSNIYRASDSPNYRPGHAVVLAFMAVCLLGGSVVTLFLLNRENKLRAQGKRDHVVEGLTPEQYNRLGDKRPDFRYTL